MRFVQTSNAFIMTLSCAAIQSCVYRKCVYRCIGAARRAATDRSRAYRVRGIVKTQLTRFGAINRGFRSYLPGACLENSQNPESLRFGTLPTVAIFYEIVILKTLIIQIILHSPIMYFINVSYLSHFIS